MIKNKIFKSESFLINENSKLIRSFDEIVSNIENKKEQLVDVRDSEEFNKDIEGIKNNIPNSKNLPYNTFFDSENGGLKNLEELKQCNTF